MKLQSVEMQLYSGFISIAIFIILAKIDPLNFYALIVPMVIFLIGVILLPIYIAIYNLVLRNKQNVKSFYNPFSRMIEIHVGRNATEKKMLKNCMRARRDAKKMNVGIIFYTNHFSRERLEEVLNGELEVKRANVFQYMIFYMIFTMILFGKKKPKRYPLMCCILRAKKIE